MKKVFKGLLKFLMAFLFLFVGAIMAFGQDLEVGTWANLIENYALYFAEYTGIAAIASFLVEYLIRLLKVTVKWQKMALVIVLAVGVSWIGNLFNIGYLAEAPWYVILLNGGLAGATAAGLRSGNVLFFKNLVDWVINWIATKEPTV